MQEAIPVGIEDLKTRYGDPLRFADRKGSWEGLVLRTQKLKCRPLKYAYGPAMVQTVRAHSKIVELLCATLEQCVSAGVERLVYGGVYCYRPKRSAGSDLSVHSWGLAIDIDPVNNVMGRPWSDNGIGLDPKTIEIFESAGFEWGGRWLRPDPMHFQWCSGY